MRPAAGQATPQARVLQQKTNTAESNMSVTGKPVGSHQMNQPPDLQYSVTAGAGAPEP